MQRIILIICVFLCIVGKGFGQTLLVDSLRSDFDKMYGLDILLNNGKKYFPDSNPVIGYPFWRSKIPFLSDITISGKTFKDQNLKYNLDKQEFILVYTNFNGQQGQIILNSSAIDSVSAGMYTFVPNKHLEIRQSFVQLIYQGHLSCYIAWYKELKCNTMGANAGYQYSNDCRKYYLAYNGAVNRFSTKSSFIRNFKLKERVSIRKYIFSNRLHFKNMDDNNLKKLISFCNETVF